MRPSRATNAKWSCLCWEKWIENKPSWCRMHLASILAVEQCCCPIRCPSLTQIIPHRLYQGLTSVGQPVHSTLQSCVCSPHACLPSKFVRLSVRLLQGHINGNNQNWSSTLSTLLSRLSLLQYHLRKAPVAGLFFFLVAAPIGESN